MSVVQISAEPRCDKDPFRDIRTIKDYFKRAKANPKMLKVYPWLANVEFCGNKKAVTIRNRHSGEKMTFKTVKECCITLGISEKTYHTKFKKGKGDSAKDWEVVDDLGRGKCCAKG